MKCPICKDRHHVVPDLHSDGFCANMRECGTCGTIWTWRDNVREIIKTGEIDRIAILESKIERLTEVVEKLYKKLEKTDA